MDAKKTIEIRNKKAQYDYFIISRHTAGIVLSGTEIKSIREGKVNLSDSYCSFFNEELFVQQLYIAEYTFGTHYNHEPKRGRKLLLQRHELKKLHAKMKEKGFTLIPTKLFINEKGLAKLEIALAKGKKMYDKRETIKEKDVSREQMRNQK